MSNLKVTANDITGLVSKAGLKIEDGHEKDYSVLLSTMEDAIAALTDDKILMPRPDLSKYPRTDVQIPKDSEGGGWATKASPCRCTENGKTTGNVRSSNGRSHYLGHHQSILAYWQSPQRQNACYQG